MRVHLQSNMLFSIFICQAHMELNDIDAAAESFSKALELEPNDGKEQFFTAIYVSSLFFLFE